MISHGKERIYVANGQQGAFDLSVNFDEKNEISKTNTGSEYQQRVLDNQENF